MFLKKIILAGSAALAPIVLTAIIDANPSLYIYDRIVATDHRRTQSVIGKHIWITGASSGIGAELAKQLSYHGAHLVLSARDQKRLNAIATECREIRSRNKKRLRRWYQYPYRHWDNSEQNVIHVLPMDVTASSRQIRKKVQCALNYFHNQGIDILVLNAGRGQLSPALLTNSKSTEKLMDVNFHAPVNLAMATMHQDSWETTKNKKRKGHIVVTSSVAAKLGTPLSSSYAGSKHAVHGYFSSLRSEYGDWLRVDLPCPGPVSTNLSNEVVTAGNKNDALNFAKQRLQRYMKATVDPQNTSKDEKKMSAQRCASLIFSTMIGPTSLFHETWIAEQPTLGVMYLSHFIPSVGNKLLSLAGKVRVKAWIEGLPLYEVEGLQEAWRRLKNE